MNNYFIKWKAITEDQAQINEKTLEDAIQRIKDEADDGVEIAITYVEQVG